jgi:hypothetical protein
MKIDERTREKNHLDNYDKFHKILGYILSYSKPEDTILELGAGHGENLKFLQDYDYKNLYALEPFEEDIGKPKGINVIIGTIKEKIKEIEPKDIIFTVSTLYLIPDDECMFEEIAKKVKKYLITFEGEIFQKRVRDWLIERNYKTIFEKYGLKQVEEEEWEIGNLIFSKKPLEHVKNIKMIRVFKNENN